MSAVFKYSPHHAGFLKIISIILTRVKRFYARPPLGQDWWADEIKKINYPADRRQAVAAILERQNREFGAGKRLWQTLSGCGRARRQWSLGSKSDCSAGQCFAF